MPVKDQFPIVIIIVPDRGLPVSRLKEFFLPPDGVAMIFVEHRRIDDPYDISPSGMAGALASLAPERKFGLVTDVTAVEKNQLYLVPAGSNIEIREGRLTPVRRARPESEPWMPDYFLSRMAVGFRDRIIAILADHTGMLGAHCVRHEGGFVYIVAGSANDLSKELLPYVDGPLMPGQFSRLFATRRSGGLPRIMLSPEADPGRLLEQEIFAQIWKRRSQKGGSLRIWIVGPESGDIAYSVAIRLFSYLDSHDLYVKTQVFASQLNQREVDRARLGMFEDTDLGYIPEVFRERYFSRNGDGMWHVLRSVQQTCIFAVQHPVADPPYSRCDLIICDEFVALLSEYDRERLFRNFHYALQPHGCLLMSGEGARTLKTSALFEPVDRIPGLYTPVEQMLPVTTPATSSRPPSVAEMEADRILMTAYVPAAMLVDEQLRVIRFYGVVSPYLRRRQERPSLHLLHIVRDELIFDLSDLLEQADKTRQPAAKNEVFLSEEGGPEYRLEVVPITIFDRKSNLIIIRERTPVPDPDLTDDLVATDARIQRIRALERQVQKLRYQLQSAHRLFKQTQEEMQRVIEELVSSNEELQCFNQELESINYDLQERNRELKTLAQLTPEIRRSI